MGIEVQQADLFGVPLLDGSVAIGQVVEIDATPSGTALCLLTSQRQAAGSSIAPVSRSEVVAIQLCRTDALIAGLWRIDGFEQIPRLRDAYPLDQNVVLKFHDEPVHDAAVIEAFCNACHGLYPWDGFARRDFFDGLLLQDVGRPMAARLKSQMT